MTMEGRRLSARDAEKLLGISASTIRTWYQRKARTGLEPVDFQRGKPRFAEFDLVQLRDGKRKLQGQPSVQHGELGRYMAAWEAEKLLGIPASTVRTWHQRQETTGLYEAGPDEHGRPLFYEVDLIVLRRGLRLRNDQDRRIHTMPDVA